MKRDRELEEGEQDQSSAPMAAADASGVSSSAGKEKLVWSEEPESGGMDELLEALGYKVRSSDMADVAQKLEQLEMAMGTTMEDGISQLSETTHYNPSDLSSWVESMLSEINNTAAPPTSFDSVVLPGQSSGTMIDFSNNNESGQQGGGGMVFNDGSQYDLRAIAGGAIFGAEAEPVSKRTRTMPTGSDLSIQPAGLSAVAGAGNGLEPSRPVVIVDSQETGIRLVHTLMACADAVQQDDMKLADALVNHIAVLATSQAGAMRKVATYFAQALARRIYPGMLSDSIDPSYLEILQMHFYESCPYLKFAHFTANQAILEAFAGANRVHVIDFSLKQGVQWPALMQALALRPGGPPAFRLTGIGPPQQDNTDALQQVGWKLAELAETIGVEFEFRGFVANSLADLDAAMLEIRPSEVESVAVNSVFELHPLLARPGGIEKVLSSIKAMNPKIVTVVEQEANHNGLVFVDRFNEALHYYSTMFDSLESSGLTQRNNSQSLIMTEVYLGRQIANVVACEGLERVERHETLTQWRERMNSAGFDPVHLGSNAFTQASMLLALFAGGVGYRVEENGGCLMLGWHTRPLIATSAWQLAPENISGGIGGMTA